MEGGWNIWSVYNSGDENFWKIWEDLDYLGEGRLIIGGNFNIRTGEEDFQVDEEDTIRRNRDKVCCNEGEESREEEETQDNIQLGAGGEAKKNRFRWTAEDIENFKESTNEMTEYGGDNQNRWKNMKKKIYEAGNVEEVKTVKKWSLGMNEKDGGTGIAQE
ncbi:hypothetical protein QAD02_013681 [Eretmocerus hayati]|uniref:Uncharacterized protein n=1 Tax=Eretmocerus hayati TaxID=131215 RepID=A0ACC2P3J6_9HYME|nr:hypothetical protein QAD02_013681 [Eretmocerus hayati]